MSEERNQRISRTILHTDKVIKKLEEVIRIAEEHEKDELDFSMSSNSTFHHIQ